MWKKIIFLTGLCCYSLSSLSFERRPNGDGYHYRGSSMEYDIVTPFELGTKTTNNTIPLYSRHYSADDLPRKFDNFGNAFLQTIPRNINLFVVITMAIIFAQNFMQYLIYLLLAP